MIIYHFDTWDYPKDNFSGLLIVNKKYFDRVKDEFNGRYDNDSFCRTKIKIIFTLNVR